MSTYRHGHQWGGECVILNTFYCMYYIKHFKKIGYADCEKNLELYFCKQHLEIIYIYIHCI